MNVSDWSWFDIGGGRRIWSADAEQARLDVEYLAYLARPPGVDNLANLP